MFDPKTKKHYHERNFASVKTTTKKNTRDILKDIVRLQLLGSDKD